MEDESIHPIPNPSQREPDESRPSESSSESANGTVDAGEVSEESEGAVPPGYDWPTHGGYLGCLLAVMASCLIGGFLGTTLFAALGYQQIVPRPITALLTVVVFVVVTIGLGRLGWFLGKRFYREYPHTAEK